MDGSLMVFVQRQVQCASQSSLGKHQKKHNTPKYNRASERSDDQSRDGGQTINDAVDMGSSGDAALQGDHVKIWRLRGAAWHVSGLSASHHPISRRAAGSGSIGA